MFGFSFLGNKAHTKNYIVKDYNRKKLKNNLTKKEFFCSPFCSFYVLCIIWKKSILSIIHISTHSNLDKKFVYIKKFFFLHLLQEKLKKNSRLTDFSLFYFIIFRTNKRNKKKNFFSYQTIICKVFYFFGICTRRVPVLRRDAWQFFIYHDNMCFL